jgi:Peptidase family M1 domain
VLAIFNVSRAAAAELQPERCSAGAHTLAPAGSRLYPETGNGGYTSVHTNVSLMYDATANRFLAGSHVALEQRATQCLSSFTLDFERTSANATSGPDMAVDSVSVNGQPASFTFVQPTYPGDPNGPGDPDPRAHEASQESPVGGPENNPLPPACSPELLSEEPAQRDSLDGAQCPANKLLITPRVPIRRGPFTVTVYYEGRPGVHNDGDGTTEGWFRSGEGSFVSTEPVGSEDWMPLNDYPSAKPTYDFSETSQKGDVAIANGLLQGTVVHGASGAYPGGSATWSWHEAAPTASYLVQSSIGDYPLSVRTSPNGMTYYEAQDASIPAAQQAQNAMVLATQPEVTEYESQWGGAFPFPSDGAIVGASTEVGFDEEMESMISFSAGEVPPSVLWHENFHQWFGDNVSEATYEMTFFKEGLAQWMESYVYPARRRGPVAFKRHLIRRFDRTYRKAGKFWTIAPSKPFPYSLFDDAATYDRPAAAYDALHQILGEPGFAQALQQIQHQYGGSSITEPQLEQVFHERLPNHSEACQARLDTFFVEWFDTAYPPGGGPGGRPRITGRGLEGENFYREGCIDSAAATPQEAPLEPGPDATEEAEEAEEVPSAPAAVRHTDADDALSPRP